MCILYLEQLPGHWVLPYVPVLVRWIHKISLGHFTFMVNKKWEFVKSNWIGKYIAWYDIKSIQFFFFINPLKKLFIYDFTFRLQFPLPPLLPLPPHNPLFQTPNLPLLHFCLGKDRQVSHEHKQNMRYQLTVRIPTSPCIKARQGTQYEE